jgi:hypothetical protein
MVTQISAVRVNNECRRIPHGTYVVLLSETTNGLNLSILIIWLFDIYIIGFCPHGWKKKLQSSNRNSIGPRYAIETMPPQLEAYYLRMRLAWSADSSGCVY